MLDFLWPVSWENLAQVSQDGRTECGKIITNDIIAVTTLRTLVLAFRIAPASTLYYYIERYHGLVPAAKHRRGMFDGERRMLELRRLSRGRGHEAVEQVAEASLVSSAVASQFGCGHTM
jgi:hypothetical protein